MTNNGIATQFTSLFSIWQWQSVIRAGQSQMPIANLRYVFRISPP